MDFSFLLRDAFNAGILSIFFYGLARYDKRLPSFGFLDFRFIVPVMLGVAVIDLLFGTSPGMGASLARGFIFSSEITIITSVMVKFFPYQIKNKDKKD